MLVSRLKHLMLEQKISQVELSAKIGISKTSLNQILQGNHVPKIKTVELLARALGVPVSYFFDIEHTEYSIPLNGVPLSNPVISASTVIQILEQNGKLMDLINYYLQGQEETNKLLKLINDKLNKTECMKKLNKMNI
jgi:transcriptional regulator with XRE-family HTH domain